MLKAGYKVVDWQGLVTGWGRTSENGGPLSTTLLKVGKFYCWHHPHLKLCYFKAKVPIQSDQDCNNAYNGAIGANCPLFTALFNLPDWVKGYQTIKSDWTSKKFRNRSVCLYAQNMLNLFDFVPFYTLVRRFCKHDLRWEGRNRCLPGRLRRTSCCTGEKSCCKGKKHSAKSFAVSCLIWSHQSGEIWFCVKYDDLWSWFPFGDASFLCEIWN